MKSFLKQGIVLSMLVHSAYAFSECPDAGGTLRGEYALRSPSEGTLLQIRQTSNAVAVQVIQNDASMLYSQPAVPGVDQWVVIEGTGEAVATTICLYAPYDDGSRGGHRVDTMPLSQFSNETISLYQQQSRAARYWAEGSSSGRRQAADIYADLFGVSAQLGQQTHIQSAIILAAALSEMGEFSDVVETLDAVASLPAPDAMTELILARYRAEALLRMNQPVLAENTIKEALANHAAHITSEQHVNLSQLHVFLSEALLAQQKTDEAIILIQRAFELAADNYPMLGKVYNILGYHYIVQSQLGGLVTADRRAHLSDAIDVMLTGRFFAYTAQDSRTLTAIDNNLGFVYDRLGEFRRAQFHYQQVLHRSDPDDDPTGFRFVYSNLGRTYQYLADYSRSESYYREAIGLAEQSTGVTSLSRCALGTTLRLRGEVDSALLEHELCLNQAERSGNTGAVVLARFELGENYLALDAPDEAWEHIHWAWANSESGVAPGTRARILRRYILMLQERGQSASADEALRELMFISDNQGDWLSAADHVENRATAMRLALLRAEYNHIEEYGYDTLRLIESHHETLDSEREGPTWSERTHVVFVQFAEYFLQRYLIEGDPTHLEAAFDINERSRAISLRQQLSAPRADEHLATREQLAVISRLANQYAGVSDETNVLPGLPAEYYRQQDVLSLQRLAGRTRFPLPPAMNLQHTQQQLADHQAVLYYMVGETAGYRFVVTKNTFQVEQVMDMPAKSVATDSLRTQLADVNSVPYQALATHARALLPATDSIQGITELLIVPHANLLDIPFAALPLTDTADYQPLISRYALKILPSLSTYFMQKTVIPASALSDLAVIADPVFDTKQFEQQLIAANGNAQPAIRGWSSSLQRLPNTAVEAEILGELFAAGRPVILTGPHANRGSLARDDVRSARILHIATHGYFNDSNDENVGLVFSIVNEDGSPDSGFVTLPELFSYRFNNELVVISGCDTNMGRSLGGEGMMGLTRGFLAQGARHVIATQWPVSDRASAVFMQLFYQHLLELEDVAVALQAAQRDMQQNPAYRHPFYWAAYVLASVSTESSVTLAAR